MFYIVFLFVCLVPTVVFCQAGCSCSQDPTQTPIQQSCTGDTQVFVGDTELFAGEWITCPTTLFTSTFSITPQNIPQTIEIYNLFQVQGDMIIPTTSGANNTILYIDQNIPSNATLEVLGNLLVDGVLNITVTNVIIHGNVIVSSTGQLFINPGNILIINGNVTSQNDITFVGSIYSNIPVDLLIGGAVEGTNSITLDGFRGSIKGGIYAPSANLTVGALTVTSINTTSILVGSINLVMLPVDQGQANFNKRFVIFDTIFPVSASITFHQGWNCGSYNVTPNISNSTGISIFITGLPLNITSPNYCCFEGLDPCACAPYSGQPIPASCTPVCVGWVCDTTGFIIGWIVGGVLASTILTFSCYLLGRDFKESVLA